MAHTPKQINTWDAFQNLEEDVEKLIYPMQSGDNYDTGKINEVLSQIYVFQGILSKFN